MDRPARVGFFGPFGTFAEQAVRSRPDLGAAELVDYPTVPDVFDAVAAGDPLTSRAVTGSTRLTGLPGGSAALAVPAVEPVVLVGATAVGVVASGAVPAVAPAGEAASGAAARKVAASRKAGP